MLGDVDVEYIPVQYGQEPPQQAFDKDAKLFVLDFSYSRDVMFELAAMRHEEMVVLDHHKTAKQALEGIEIELASNNCGDALHVKFDMTKSGGRLTWEHFHSGEPSPWLVDYSEDRDLWAWKLGESKEVNAFLRSWPLDFDGWDRLNLTLPGSARWYEWIAAGAAILRREKQIVDQHVGHASEIVLTGHKILAVNATVLFSEIAGELAKDRPFGACWFDRKDGLRQWSLRSREGGVDVSEVAKKFGGGGHPQAAGFEVSSTGVISLLLANRSEPL